MRCIHQSILLASLLFSHVQSASVFPSFRPLHSSGSTLRNICRKLPDLSSLVVAIDLDEQQNIPAQLTRIDKLYNCLDDDHVLIFSSETRTIGRYRIYYAGQVHSEEVLPHDEYRNAPDQHRLMQVKSSGNRATTNFRHVLSTPPVRRREKVMSKDRLLHMLRQTWEMRPDKDWYLFVDTSAYVSLANLLRYLRSMNSNEFHVLTDAIRLPKTDVDIANEEAPLVLSGAVLKKLISLGDGSLETWSRRAATRDHAHQVISAILQEQLNLTVTGAWPYLRGDSPHSITFTTKVMCEPVVSLAHVPFDLLTSLHDLETQRLAQSSPDPAKHLLHADLFALLGHSTSAHTLRVFASSKATFAFQPRWDNFAAHFDNVDEEDDDDRPIPWIYPSSQDYASPYALSEDPNVSVDSCARACEALDQCITFSYMSFEARWSGGPNAGGLLRDGGLCFLNRVWRFGMGKDEVMWEDDGGDGRFGRASVMNRQVWSAGWYLERWKRKVEDGSEDKTCRRLA